MRIDSSRGRVKAVLGPTNTGKTHLAMERMLAHKSGMVGFPLRLLARENYDRAVAKRGRLQVALITGEEKIVPPTARYFVTTVESMPLGRPVEFLAVDEIQMCADADRGHVFTDRLLHARGAAETMFMGAETIRPLLARLVPDAEFVSRPRFSTLTHTGPRRVDRLNPRSAAVAFSAADVYAIAELMRHHRGGAAVVLGALSPRTRNAQVAMYQAGEVDFLVATDAIGMGLNMDIDHVAFAGLVKFDGRGVRALTPAELAQTAGRAGRHMNDGTFGTTADAPSLDADIVALIEGHTFAPLRVLSWRSRDLRFDSIRALRRSLSRPPSEEGLVRAREADDERALAALADDAEIRDLATTADAVRLLWEVAQIPDFRKVASDAHACRLGRIYRSLMAGDDGAGSGRLPEDWIAENVARIDRTDGDIEALVARIGDIRTWTYVSYRADWLDDAAHWQERTRGVEDRLSDALHECLTQRFVDKRTAVLVGRRRRKGSLDAAVADDGEVWVEGEELGRIDGLRYQAAPGVSGAAAKAAAAAVAAALDAELRRRVARLEADPDDALELTPSGRVAWHGDEVARLTKGPHVLGPGLALLAWEGLAAPLGERARARLAAWLDAHLAARLGPLYRIRDARLEGAARGVAFQLAEGLGSVPRRRAERELRALAPADRRRLAGLGVCIGRESVFLPALLKPGAVALRAQLWSLVQGRPQAPDPPAPGRVSVALAAALPTGFYEAVGYRPLGPRAVRIDIVERLAAQVRALARSGPFAAPPELMALAGCGWEDLGALLLALGCEPVEGEAHRYRLRPRRPAGRRRRTGGKADCSPFARLKELALVP